MRVAVFLYALGLALLLLGASGFGLPGLGSWAAALAGLVLFGFGLVVEQRALKD